MISLFDASDCCLSEQVTLNIDGDFDLVLHPDNTVFSETGGNIEIEWTFLCAPAFEDIWLKGFYIYWNQVNVKYN